MLAAVKIADPEGFRMTDLVKRLRADEALSGEDELALMYEAADRIEQLEAALRNIDNGWASDDVHAIARAALGQNAKTS